MHWYTGKCRESFRAKDRVFEPQKFKHMKLHPNELLIYYDNKSSSHKKTKALAYSISSHVKELDIDHYKLTKLMWGEILELLHLEAKQLLNKADPAYQADIAGHNFDDDGWLEILVKNPRLIKAPIAILNKKAVLCESPKDIYKLTGDVATTDVPAQY